MITKRKNYWKWSAPYIWFSLTLLGLSLDRPKSRNRWVAEFSPQIVTKQIPPNPIDRFVQPFGLNLQRNPGTQAWTETAWLAADCFLRHPISNKYPRSENQASGLWKNSVHEPSSPSKSFLNRKNAYTLRNFPFLIAFQLSFTPSHPFSCLVLTAALIGGQRVPW